MKTPNGELVWATDIRQALAIGARCLNGWMARGKFPPPDGNVNGRRFWLRSTVEQWRTDVAAGKYAQTRRPKFPAIREANAEVQPPPRRGRSGKRAANSASGTL